MHRPQAPLRRIPRGRRRGPQAGSPARALAWALAAALALPLPAQAARPPVYPRWGSELRLTPYRPALSDAADVRALRTLVFDHDDRSIFHGRPLMFGAEVEYYAWQEVGLLGPMVQVGYWSQSGTARKCVEGDTVVECTAQTVLASQKGTDSATLLVLPVSLGAVYRYDGLRRAFELPLVFHAKAGLTYFLWWGQLGGSTSAYHGRHARGASLGYFGSLGASLVLTGLGQAGGPRYGQEGKDGQSAALFAEVSVLRGRDLLHPSGHRLDLTDNLAVTVGLSVAFR